MLHFSLTLTGASLTPYLQVHVFQPLATQDGEHYNTRNCTKYHRKVHQIPSTWLRYLWLNRSLNTLLELSFFWRRGRGKGSKVRVVLNLTADPVLFQPLLEHLPLKTQFGLFKTSLKEGAKAHTAMQMSSLGCLQLGMWSFLLPLTENKCPLPAAPSHQASLHGQYESIWFLLKTNTTTPVTPEHKKLDLPKSLGFPLFQMAVISSETHICKPSHLKKSSEKRAQMSTVLLCNTVLSSTVPPHRDF